MASADAIIRRARDHGRATLDEPDAKALLAESGLDVPAGIRVARGDDLAGAAAGLSPPFAVKLISPDAVHKSDLGMVRVGVPDLAAADALVVELDGVARAGGLRVDGFLIEEMAPAGRELVIGGIDDPRFGPVIMTGLGGIFVEVFQDVAFRVCPIDRQDAADMLDELRAAPLLAGARGQRPVSRESVIAALLKIGGDGGLLMRFSGEIVELDINPLIVSPTGAVAVDARIVLKERLTLA